MPKFNPYAVTTERLARGDVSPFMAAKSVQSANHRRVSTCKLPKQDCDATRSTSGRKGIK